MVPMEPPVVRDEPQRNRFVLNLAEGEAFATYRRVDDYLIISHTEVPRASRGLGIGSQLAKALFGHARQHNQRIVPACSFIADWVGHHPEYHDVLAQEF
jgi:predicted GNAT family acetyltransferase